MAVIIFFGVVASVAFMILAIVMLVQGADRYDRFGLSPNLLFNLWRKRAIIKKRFKYPLSVYGYEKLDADPFGTVWELSPKAHAEIIRACRRAERSEIGARQRIVRVIDSTTSQTYFLGVPMARATSTPKGAVAWTFGMTADQYQPTVET